MEAFELFQFLKKNIKAMTKKSVVGSDTASASPFKTGKSRKTKSGNGKTLRSLGRDKEAKIVQVRNLIDMISLYLTAGYRLEPAFQYVFLTSPNLYNTIGNWKYRDEQPVAQTVFSVFLKHMWILEKVVKRLPKRLFKEVECFSTINEPTVNHLQGFLEIVCEQLQKSDEDVLLEKKSEDQIPGLKKEIYDLKQENFALKQNNFSLIQKLNHRNNLRNQMEEKIRSLENELMKLKDSLEKLSEEHQETLYDLGKMSFERATNINKTKKAKNFQKIFDTKKSSGSIDEQKASGSSSSSNKPTTCSGQGLDLSHSQQHVSQSQKLIDELPSSSQLTPREQLKTDTLLVELCEPTQVNKTEASYPNSDSNVKDQAQRSNIAPSISVEVDKPREGESMSLRNEHCSSVMAEVRNLYRLLLVTIADRLLIGDIAKLKDWANEISAVETYVNAAELVYQLDQKGVINAFDLSQLRAFFELILRFDLVYLIDEFTKGDYPSLRNLIYLNNPKKQSRGSNSNQNPRCLVLTNDSTPRSPLNPTVVNSDGRNARALERTGENEHRNLSNVNNQMDWNKKLPSLRACTSTGPRNSVVEFDGLAAGGNISQANSTTTCQDNTSHGPRKQCNSTSQSQRKNRHQTFPNHNIHQKKWLCTHYKRRCYVKFDCCDKFWPCHQCHNKESTCSHKKLKSRDTTMIKCFECGKEQQFGQFCVACNIKFADFYCGQCKHLTGMDDFPYHCDKCGICRIHGDRSFHCDVCGVCLDVQLRGNHKCRPDSAHDQCGICLEDAFTGCQILPCSHKVHKNCATQMIQSGITRCPICRESFAHKLNKRPAAKKLTRKR